MSAMAKTRKPAQTKAAKAEAKAARKAASKQRRSQLWQAFKMQRKEDKRLLPYMIGAFVAIVAASVALGLLIGVFTKYLMIMFGVTLGILIAFIIFGRRAQKNVYRKADCVPSAYSGKDACEGTRRRVAGVGPRLRSQ